MDGIDKGSYLLDPTSKKASPENPPGHLLGGILCVFHLLIGFSFFTGMMVNLYFIEKQFRTFELYMFFNTVTLIEGLAFVSCYFRRLNAVGAYSIYMLMFSAVSFWHGDGFGFVVLTFALLHVWYYVKIKQADESLEV